MRYSVEDRKKDPRSEGVNILKYSFFGDPEAMIPTVDSVVEVAGSINLRVPSIEPDEPDTLRNLRLVGLGVGAGILEENIARQLEVNGIPTELFLSDRQYDQSFRGSDYVILNNKALPFAPNSVDIVFARSVTHYAPTIEAEQDTLRQIYDCLAPGGAFITQVPAQKTIFEASVLREIHALLPKVMNIMPLHHTRQMLNEIFAGKVEDAPYQTSQMLHVDRESFTARYGPQRSDYKSLSDYARACLHHQQLLLKIRGMIAAMSEELPSMQVNGIDFSWDVPFHTFVCRK